MAQRVLGVSISDACTVCDVCEEIVPDVFLIADGKCTIRAEASDAGYLRQRSAFVIRAAEQCPDSAIKLTWVDDDIMERFYKSAAGDEMTTDEPQSEQQAGRDEHGRFVASPVSATEFDEIAQFCSRCGQPKGDFDVFCGRCSAPLVRRFRFLFPAEIILFLAAAVVLALANGGKLDRAFMYAPLAFLGQFLILYFARLSLRQRRFVVLATVYVAFVVAALAGIEPSAALISAGPLYLAVGVIILWCSRWSSSARSANMQTLWVGTVFVGLSISVFGRLDGLLQARVRDQELLALASNGLKHYTPWFGLAGLCITLAIEAGLQVARRGVSVREDYYPNARIATPSTRQPIPLPIYLVPFVVMARIVKRALVAFYNTLVSVLNAMTRSLVFVWQIVVSFIASFWFESIESLSRLVGFAFLCVVRVAVPLFAISIAASVSIESNEIVRLHAFSPTLDTTVGVLWITAQLLIAVFACVLCFAKTPPKQFIEGYSRDLAILVGYGIPLLLLCSVALALASAAVRHWVGFDMRFKIAQLSWACLAVLALGAAVLWRTRILAILRRIRRGESTD